MRDEERAALYRGLAECGAQIRTGIEVFRRRWEHEQSASADPVPVHEALRHDTGLPVLGEMYAGLGQVLAAQAALALAEPEVRAVEGWRGGQPVRVEPTGRGEDDPPIGTHAEADRWFSRVLDEDAERWRHERSAHATTRTPDYVEGALYGLMFARTIFDNSRRRIIP